MFIYLLNPVVPTKSELFPAHTSILKWKKSNFTLRKINRINNIGKVPLKPPLLIDCMIFTFLDNKKWFDVTMTHQKNVKKAKAILSIFTTFLCNKIWFNLKMTHWKKAKSGLPTWKSMEIFTIKVAQIQTSIINH